MSRLPRQCRRDLRLGGLPKRTFGTHAEAGPDLKVIEGDGCCFSPTERALVAAVGALEAIP